MSYPAVFLDRDGVINANRSDYVKSLQEFEFLDNVFAPLRTLGQRYKLVVISNQSAVGRGLIDRATVEGIHRHMISSIERNGAKIDAVYWCPHQPIDQCQCRKPRPGLLFQAAEALELDLHASFLIGDACSDVEAATHAGVKPVMVLTGRGEQQYAILPEEARSAVPVCQTLAEAAAWILSYGDSEPNLSITTHLHQETPFHLPTRNGPC